MQDFHISQYKKLLASVGIRTNQKGLTISVQIVTKLSHKSSHKLCHKVESQNWVTKLSHKIEPQSRVTKLSNKLSPKFSHKLSQKLSRKVESQFKQRFSFFRSLDSFEHMFKLLSHACLFELWYSDLCFDDLQILVWSYSMIVQNSTSKNQMIPYMPSSISIVMLLHFLWKTKHSKESEAWA